MGTTYPFLRSVGVNFLVKNSIMVKYKVSPVPYLIVVGPCPLFSPLTPYCLKILTAASNDPL